MRTTSWKPSGEYAAALPLNGWHRLVREPVSRERQPWPRPRPAVAQPVSLPGARAAPAATQAGAIRVPSRSTCQPPRPDQGADVQGAHVLVRVTPPPPI